MYSNVFDTVRTDVGQRVNFEGLMYTSILSGLHPTLSLTQAIDSKPLIDLLTNSQYGDSFLSFIRNGRIRVSKYSNFANERRPITLNYKNQLKKNAVDPASPDSFYFSSLPLLKPNTEKYSNPNYSNEDIGIIFRCMHDAIEQYYESDSNALALFEQLLPESLKSCREEVHRHIKAVTELEAAIREKINFYPPSNSSGQKVLYTRFMEYYAKYHEIIYKQEEDTNPNFTEAIENLYSIYNRPNDAATWSKRNNRSYIYSLIDSLSCDSVTEKELKSIIDLCYNETVAASIYDGGENEILSFDHRLSMVNHYQSTLPEQECLDTVFEKYSLVNMQCVEADEEATLRESQKRELFANSNKYDRNRHYFTWEIMQSLFDEIGWKELPPEKWYSTIQRECEEYSQKLEFDNKRLFRGTICVESEILATALSSIPMIEPSASPYVALPYHLITISTILYNYFDKSHIMSKQEKTEAKVKAKLAKELLTNVSTLRKDLNGGKAYDDKQTD